MLIVIYTFLYENKLNSPFEKLTLFGQNNRNVTNTVNIKMPSNYDS